VLLLQLKRTHVFEWVRAVLAAALGLLPGGHHLPPIYFQQEVNSVWDQISESGEQQGSAVRGNAPLMCRLPPHLLSTDLHV
jgi:hypothetical protein